MKTQDELAQMPLSPDELNRLNGIRVWAEVLIDNTRWRVNHVHWARVAIRDDSRSTAWIRMRLNHLFDDTGFLSYNSLELSRISWWDKRDSVITNTVTRTPWFIVQLPE